MKLDLNIYDKLIRFCVYRDRCEQEVKAKLKTLQVWDSDPYIDELIEDDYLNDSRYAQSYAQGRFRMKYWGKQKIKAHLGGKRISTSLISNALDAIDMDEYRQIASHLIQRKSEEVKGKDEFEKSGKVYRYMLQKGFESSLISELLKEQKEATKNTM